MRILGWLVLVLMVVSQSQAMFMQVDKDVPLKDILPQIQKRVKDNPKDAHAHYLLGRIHSLAWATGGDQVRLVPAKGEDELPTFAPYASVQISRQKQEKPDEAALKHLATSVEHYRKAVELDEKNGLYRLGYAWMLEQQLATGETDAAPSLQQVIDEYVKAFDLTLERDIKTNDRLMAGDSFVSVEAANNAVRLIKTMKEQDEKLVARLEKGKAEVMSQPIAITPVIVALDAKTTFSQMINDGASVTFDLAGLGTDHRWPWVTAKAGVLVWDPRATGRIESGRQLFGNMTWQMLFRDGYEALSTLDRNGDGALNGRELDGIGLWVDQDQDAVSDPGEVLTVTGAGIESIRVNASRDASGMLHVTHGVTWRDGRVTASYDWVPTSKPLVKRD